MSAANFLWAGILASATCLLNGSLSGSDWPQFRGPNCSGISGTEETLPTTFSASHNVRWRREIGDGVGSPVVAAGRVFVTAMVSKKHVGVFAFEAKTGAPLWERVFETGELAEVHKTNSHASTTPAADAERVYFYFSTLGMHALDAKTGELVWHHDLPTPFFVFKWGPAMSPTLYKDRLLFVQDDDLHPAFYAFDKRTGKLLWKDSRRDMAVNYSHPVICETETGDEIVVGGTGQLIGYDPQTGNRLWQARVLLRNIKTTPVSQDGNVYVSLQSSGIANQWLATADRQEGGNNDGRLTKAEMQAFVGEVKIPDEFFRRTFDRGDLNGDGFLEGAELDRAFLNAENFAGARHDATNPADEFVLAVRGGGRGDVTESHLLWKRKTKYTDHIVSPLVKDGRMMLVKGGGIQTLFGTDSGQPMRGPKRLPNASDYFASPVYGDDKIYLAGENGTVLVLENSPQYEVLAKNDMGDSILATPAISGDSLFIRTRQHLVCVAEADAAADAGSFRYHTPPSSDFSLMDQQHRFDLPSVLVADDGTPVRSPAAWSETRRPELLKHWTSILGKLAPSPDDKQWFGDVGQIVETSRREEDGYTRIELQIPIEKDFLQPHLLLVPKGQGNGPFPAVIAWTSTSPDYTQPEKWWGAWLARRGFVVLTGWSHIRNYRDGVSHRNQVNEAVYQRFGHWLPMAKMVHDVQREVEFLRGRPDVDATRVGFIGFSLSAKTALYVAAFAPEVKAVVSIDPHLALHGDTNYHDPWYLDWRRRFEHIATEDYPVPQLRNTIWSLLDADPERPGFERNHHELMALCAPRALMVIGCSTDLETARHSDDRQSLSYIRRAEEVYRLLGVPERLEYVAETGGHRATGPRIDAAWQRFFTRWLVQEPL